MATVWGSWVRSHKALNHENTPHCFNLIYAHFQTTKLHTADINERSREQQETGSPAQSFCTALVSQQQQTGLTGSSHELVHTNIFSFNSCELLHLDFPQDSHSFSTWFSAVREIYSRWMNCRTHPQTTFQRGSPVTLLQTENWLLVWLSSQGFSPDHLLAHTHKLLQTTKLSYSSQLLSKCEGTQLCVCVCL